MLLERNPQNGRIAMPCQQCGSIYYVHPSGSARRKFCDLICRRAWYANPVRFWNGVGIAAPDECWPWLLTQDRDGYGLFRPSGSAQNVRAHRYAYFLTHGRWPWPQCLHACDNPSCCNPSHLSEGTNTQNMAQRRASGHYWRGEAQRSAKLTAAAVTVIRARLAAGEPGYRMAPEYGVRPQAIYDIKRGKTWRHVP